MGIISQEVDRVIKYEVHLCKECIRVLEEEHYPYTIPNEELEIVKVSVYQCDNTVYVKESSMYEEAMKSRNPLYTDATEYIACHTRYGYYKQGGKRLDWGFTNNIAEATRFINLELLKTLCNAHHMTAYRIQNIPGMKRYEEEYVGKYSRIQMKGV